MNPKTASIIALALLAITGGILLMNQKNKDAPPANTIAKTGEPWTSDQQGESTPTRRADSIDIPESREELAAKEGMALVERKKMTAMWMHNASSSLGKKSQYLMTDLNTSATWSVSTTPRSRRCSASS